MTGGPARFRRLAKAESARRGEQVGGAGRGASTVAVRRAMEQGAGVQRAGVRVPPLAFPVVVCHEADVAVGRAARPVPDSSLLPVTVDFCLSHGVISR